uniref:Uncharacterized protein n=1 Tax=Glossina brevipalpis TaxID=37001 RepID=A0A1A9W2B8_9MUSC
MWLKKVIKRALLFIMITINCNVKAQDQFSTDEDLKRLLGRCKMNSEVFDECMKNVLNDLKAYYRTGISSYNIRPFDPHYASFIEMRRGDSNGLGGFKLLLRNISEYGWSRSEITKYHTDLPQKRIIYSQHFPEKSLEGWYEFSGAVFGTPIKRKGFWNMTLNDYSQTTSVRRLGGPGSLLKVHIEVDNMGGLKMHISDFLASGRATLDNLTDGMINTMWPLGLPFIKPMINELISTAFTDIFNESFRYFPMEKFLRYS